MNQRWLFARASYRPPAEPIDPSRYGVEPIDELTAKRFVEAHHYSRSYPAARYRVGLYELRQLVGVAVFSVPVNQHAIPKYTGESPEAGAELGRFVLLDSVAGNGETWFLSRAFKLLRRERPDIRAVLSYSDPLPRLTAAGVAIKPGHVGTIYQAHNGRHLGRSRRRGVLLTSGGQIVNERTLSKLRRDERGRDYAQEQLERLGAPRRLAGESGASYVARLLAGDLLRRIVHPGNLIYAWPLAQGVKLAPSLPYPKAGAL